MNTDGKVAGKKEAPTREGRGDFQQASCLEAYPDGEPAGLPPCVRRQAR
jgi:hypothetical protein